MFKNLTELPLLSPRAQLAINFRLAFTKRTKQKKSNEFLGKRLNQTRYFSVCEEWTREEQRGNLNIFKTLPLSQLIKYFPRISLLIAHESGTWEASVTYKSALLILHNSLLPDLYEASATPNANEYAVQAAYIQPLPTTNYDTRNEPSYRPCAFLSREDSGFFKKLKTFSFTQGLYKCQEICKSLYGNERFGICVVNCRCLSKGFFNVMNWWSEIKEDPLHVIAEKVGIFYSASIDDKAAQEETKLK